MQISVTELQISATNCRYL